MRDELKIALANQRKEQTHNMKNVVLGLICDSIELAFKHGVLCIAPPDITKQNQTLLFKWPKSGHYELSIKRVD